MVGLGTIVNTIVIIIGGIFGLLFGKRVKDQMRETMVLVCGLSVIVMSVGGVITKMMTVTKIGLEATGMLMMIGSLMIGGILGELIGIETHINRFGTWLKMKSGSNDDTSFVGAFVSTSCTVCVGAMAIMGSIEDGVNANHSILFAKSLLDAVIVCVMTASKGKGCIFSAVPIAIFQGAITVIAFFVGNFMSQGSLDALSYVGNVLIMCVGLNLVFDRNIRVANLLPSVVVAAIWGALV